MREWCGCGAAIRAGKREVKKWRDTHVCSMREPQKPAQQVPTGFTPTHDVSGSVHDPQVS